MVKCTKIARFSANNGRRQALGMLTGFGNAGHRSAPKITHHRHQPLRQRFTQAAAAEFLFRPVHRRPRSPGRQQTLQLQCCGQDLAPIALQRIHQHVLARHVLRKRPGEAS